MLCATFNNSQFIRCYTRNFKLSHMIACFFAWLLCIVVSQAHLVLNDHDQYRARPPPINPNHQLDQRSPSEVMVDLSNDLSFKILHLHSILNRNNFAFSPTALMCVLVALYEGSAGRSSLEMRNCLPMPNNRDVIRVGYRDIHRRLRTYFFDDENPLKGLSLNKENVTITAEFETVLKFYGYDLGMDMVSSTTTTAPNNNQTTATPETSLPPVSTTDASTITTKVASTTTATEKITTTEEPTTTTITSTTPSEPIEASITPEITTLETETTIVSETPQPLPVSTTLEPKEEEESPSPLTQESGEVVTLANLEKVSLAEKANFKRFKTNSKLVSQPRLEYLPAKFTPIRSKSFKRTRRHLFGLKGLDPSLFLTFMQQRTQFLQAPPPPEIIEIEAPLPPPPPPPIHVQSFSSTASIQPLDTIPLLPIQNGYLDVEQGFLSQKEDLRSEIVDHIFYVNNQDVVHTTFKVYNSVLYFRYFEQMKFSILELELDSTDYNLMIILPDYDVDLLTALSNLRLGPTLRVLRKQLKPRWVQAIIPDFELHGTVFLTNDLQNLGVCDIFEPNRADFRPMTDESGIYVKHIEQNIDVNIRTRPINHLKRSYGPQTQPIQVSVNHPFMFFIIDRDLDVATMAGRILNPLNVRIQ